MARVAVEPKPSPGRAFARSLRHLAIRDAFAALSSAWRLAFEPATSVPASARATAAGLLFSVVFVVGIGGSLLAGGGLALLGSDGPTSQQLAPGASLEPTPVASVEPTPTPSPAPVVTPSPTPSPSPTVKPPKATPKQTDDQDRPKRETPEPTERDEKDEKDERDERDEKDEKDEKDERDEKDEEDD